MKTWAFLFSLLLFLQWTSCSDDSGNTIPENASVEIQFKPIYRGNELEMGNGKFNTENNNSVNLDLIKFYLSNITFITSKNEEVLAKDIVLIDLNSFGNQKKSSLIQIAPGNYKGIKMGLGVNASINNNDPTLYDETHPLSVFNGMHWNWNNGFIFLKLEGKYNAAPNAENLPDTYLYHLGLNQLYQTLNFTKELVIDNNKTHSITFLIDVEKIFSNETEKLDLPNESSTHTTGNIPLAEKTIRMFGNSISIE